MKLLKITVVICALVLASGAWGANQITGGDFEGASGNVTDGTFGDPTGMYWGGPVGASWYEPGVACTYDGTQNNTPAGATSLLWAYPANSTGLGSEIYYQNSVATVATGDYIFAGYLRADSHPTNYTGAASALGNDRTAGLTGAVQLNDGSTGYRSATMDLSEIGIDAADAPVWEPFGLAFNNSVSGPYNVAGSYFSLGGWHVTGTLSGASPINIWVDDLTCGLLSDYSASLIVGGDFEGASGNVADGTFGDPTGMYWGGPVGASWYEPGVACTYDATQDHTTGSGTSLKWSYPANSTGLGSEIYYQHSVASVPVGDYVFSGFLRASGRPTNYDGATNNIPGADMTAGVTGAVQLNNASTGYRSTTMDLSEIGFADFTPASAPAWEGFALAFNNNVSGPYNVAGSYFSLGAWRVTGTLSGASPLDIWVDDLALTPVLTDVGDWYNY